MDPSQIDGWPAVIVAFFALCGIIASGYFSVKAQRLSKATHREVSVNGGKNNPPTLKDDVHAAKKEATATRTILISLAADMKQMLESQEELTKAQETAAERQEAANLRMDLHLTQSAQMDARLIALETLVHGFRSGRRAGDDKLPA